MVNLYILLISIFLLIYLYLKKVVYSYWKNHGVPHDEPTFLIGTFKKEFFQKKVTLGMVMQQGYDKYKSHSFYGMYILLTPVLIINDANVIKDVLIKNFQYFNGRGIYRSPKDDPITDNLFHVSGNSWKVLRTKFSSSFTPYKIKNMFFLLNEVANETIKVCNENLIMSDVFDVKDIISRYSTDTICSLFFGFNPNSLRDPSSAFRYFGFMALESRPLINALGFFAPEVLYKLRIPYFHKDVSGFFIKSFQEMIYKRMNIHDKRDDFMELMIEMIKEKQEIDENCYTDTNLDNNIKEVASSGMTIMKATAQAFAFFIGGFETTYTTIVYFLQEISENPHIQEKLHGEIDEFLQSSNELNLENLMNLEYLDMVFNETLRKHPPVPFLNRICVKDYKIPNSNYCVPKGMRILIPVYAIQRDPDIYPDPEKFDPTRFDKTNKVARHLCHFLPFGEGPRLCIGKRVAVLQIKLILFALMSKYQFSVCEKTEPIIYSRNSSIHTPASEIYLRIQIRKN